MKERKVSLGKANILPTNAKFLLEWIMCFNAFAFSCKMLAFPQETVLAYKIFVFPPKKVCVLPRSFIFACTNFEKFASELKASQRNAKVLQTTQKCLRRFLEERKYFAN